MISLKTLIYNVIGIIYIMFFYIFILDFYWNFNLTYMRLFLQNKTANKFKVNILS